MSSVPHTYRAPGKVLLFGEHSAVFGYPAVGSSLTRGLQLSVSPADHMSLVVDGSRDQGNKTPTASEVSPKDAETAQVLHQFAHFLTERAPHLPPSRITVTSDLPISSGFGSSAALCTALAQWSLAAEAAGTGTPAAGDGGVRERPGDPGERSGDHAERAGDGWERPEPWHREIWQRAHELEAFFHGTPSGIDTGLAALGGVQAFHFAPERDAESSQETELPQTSLRSQESPVPRATRLSAALPPLVVGSIPRRRSTRELVAMVRRQRDTHPAATEGTLRALGTIAEDAITLLSRDTADATLLAERAAAAQAHLSSLGVSSATLEHILTVGATAGALGGKLSGAGDGGAFYLVCADRDAARAVLAAVTGELPPGGVAFVV